MLTMPFKGHAGLSNALLCRFCGQVLPLGWWKWHIYTYIQHTQWPKSVAMSEYIAGELLILEWNGRVILYVLVHAWMESIIFTRLYKFVWSLVSKSKLKRCALGSSFFLLLFLYILMYATEKFLKIPLANCLSKRSKVSLLLLFKTTEIYNSLRQDFQLLLLYFHKIESQFRKCCE